MPSSATATSDIYTLSLHDALPISVVVSRDSFPTLSSRRHDHEAHCRADALATLFLFADSRSAPDPRAATSFVHGVGDSRRGRTLRDARVQGHCGWGPKPRAEIAGTLRLPSRTGPLCGAQRVYPPQRANPCHARRSGSRLAMLERTLWRRG